MVSPGPGEDVIPACRPTVASGERDAFATRRERASARERAWTRAFDEWPRAAATWRRWRREVGSHHAMGGRRPIISGRDGARA